MNAFERIEEVKRRIRIARSMLQVAYDMVPMNRRKDELIHEADQELAAVQELLGRKGKEER